MSQLNRRKCVPCEGGVNPLRKRECALYLKELDDWKIKNEKLIKEFAFPDFQRGLDFINKVGKIAEPENPHPNIHLAWGKVIIILWTYAIGGLSLNDFILAAKIDKIKR